MTRPASPPWVACHAHPAKGRGGPALVLLHGLLPHWSDVNRSSTSRHAYTVHCVSAAADSPDWNWLQRPAGMPLRRLDSPANEEASPR